MKIGKQALALALLGAGLAAAPGLTAQAAAPKTAEPGHGLVQKMRESAQGSLVLTTEKATGKVGFARTGPGGDLLPRLRGDSSTAAVAKATAYLDEYGAAFGAGAGDLRLSGMESSAHGRTVVFKQTYRGLPVFGATLKANLDQDGDLTSVNGFAVPNLSLSTTPRVSGTDAAARAVGMVKADPPGGAATDVSGIEATSNRLVVYRLGATRGVSGKSVLAHVVEVGNGRNVRDVVVVDANTGKALNRWSMVHDALDRELREAFIDDNGTPDDGSDDFVGFETVWEEGDPLPGDLNEDQQNLVHTSGDTYWLFANTFGRDSYDGAGHRMVTVNNDPRISCPNANWNGETTNYCNGVTSDDVVAHEWGHAYTEHTSGLIYQYQSGALNESYSDVWGETVDLINGRDDAGEGDISAKRADGLCSKYTRGAVELTINSPASVAGPCQTAPAAFGPVFDKTGVSANVFVATDEDSDGDGTADTTTNGCSPIDNADQISGNWAYVDRGACTFATKAQNVEDAGGTGIVIGNNVPGEPFSISGDADIYGVMVSQQDGAKFKSVPGPVNVTVKDVDTEDKADSYRWLVSEKSPAFGGAIRDMWNPTCYGDPGKVSDAEYVCGTDDSGGVHGNSGVPNHAYSLLVDGGQFNGVDVQGIGLDKAANIWWRTGVAYLTETSDFVDMADGLEAACQTMLGTQAFSLETAPNTPATPAGLITPDDCASVRQVIQAVELRLDPTEQCDWEPLLAKGAPPLCGGESRTVWKEKFDQGLDNWKLTEKVVFDGAHGLPWEASSAAPGRAGNRVAFAPDPADGGQCDGSADDLSSRNSMVSPTVTLPRGRARMSFEHYVATEIGYDGGNLKIKANNGDWRLVPADAFRFNAYNAELEPGEVGGVPNNTNPLAGQPGFSGTDDGSAFGSWGTSHVNLKAMGLGSGDKIKIRFDFGRDGCGGNDGWYVDNVKVVVCKKKAGNNKLAVRR